MSQQWNKNKTVWPLIAAVFWLALIAGTIAPHAGSDPLPGPQSSPSSASAGTANSAAQPISPSGSDSKSDFSSAIADLLAANPECAELSNNCQICIRKSAADADCSLPGVACSRGTWSCTKTQNGPKLAQ